MGTRTLDKRLWTECKTPHVGAVPVEAENFSREGEAYGFTRRSCHVWVSSEDLSVARVASRVAMGGHDIPEPVIRRRYKRGIRNFWRVYAPLSDTWEVYDNSNRPPALVASKEIGLGAVVFIPETWHVIQEQTNDE